VSARELITEHLDLWTGAVTKKSSSGRGNNGKVELTGIKKLRELILELAVTGKLGTQNANDSSAAELLTQIYDSRQKLGLATARNQKRTDSLIASTRQISALPQKWITAPLISLINPSRPMTYGVLKPGPDVDDGVPLVKTENVQFRHVITEFKSKISPLLDQEYRRTRLSGGEVLLTLVGSIGRCAIAPASLAGANLSRSVGLIVPVEDLDKDYLALVLTSTINDKFVAENCAGTAQKVLNIKTLEELSIPVAPLEEQRRIVQKVDDLMALCDRLEQQTSDQLEAHETLVDTLLGTLTQSENATELADNWARLAAHFDTLFTTEQSIDKLKQTILQLAVMGRLVEQDAGDEPATNLLTQIHTRKTALAGDKRIKRPRPLTQLDNTQHSYPAPAHWVWASFEDIADEISTGPFGSMIHKHDYVENGIPLVNPSHMVNGGIKEDSSVSVTPAKAEELSSYKVAKGDVVMARRGEVGRCAIVTDRESGWLCGTGSFVLRFHPTINRRFILLLFSTDTVRDYLAGNSVGTTMTNLNHGILKKMPVALPSTGEQHRIVQKVDELMALCDQLKNRLEQAGKTRCQMAEAIVDKALN
jgi:type I restriction enzyme S subunit